MKNITKYKNSAYFTTINDPQIVKNGLFKSFQSKLENLKASTINQEESYISYTVEVFRFVSNWNLLSPISDGYIEIEPIKNKIVVNYQIRFNDLFFIACFMAFASFIVSFNVSDTIFDKILFPCIMFLLYYGLNVLICILRYQHFIKKTIACVIEKEKPLFTKEQEVWIADDSKCDGCGAPLKPTDKYCQACGLLNR